MIYRKANKCDIGQCYEILKDAFKNYPFFEVYKGKNQKVFFDLMMKIWIDNSFEKGTVLIAENENNIVGIAVLKAPDDKEIDIVDFSHPESVNLVSAGGLDNVKAFIKMCESSDEACHTLSNPKWHLVLLAIPSKYKGNGIGSKMLHHCIIPYIAKLGGGLLTFNTNAERNRSFYIKNGFEEFDNSTLLENGIELGNWSYRMKINP